MYINLEKKHIEDDVGKNHRSCAYYNSGICLFNDKNCKGSSNCGSLFMFKKKNKLYKEQNNIAKDNFEFDTTKQIYHVKIKESKDTSEENVYISNHKINQLEKMGYICVNPETPVALKLSKCEEGCVFSVKINEDITCYEVLNIYVLNDNFDKVVKIDLPKEKVENHKQENIVTNECENKVLKSQKINKKKLNEKPLPSDYNLSANDLVNYQKYRADKEKIENENLELQRKKDAAAETKTGIGVISFLITMFIVGMLFAFYCEKKDGNVSIFGFIVLDIGLSLVISFIAQYIYKENNIIFYQKPKQIYVSGYLNDAAIANFNSYLNDLKLYEEYEKFTSEAYWNSLNGYEFENSVAELFKKIGYKSVRRTQGSYDGGIDILMEKDGKKYAVQCKHHSRSVGAEPLRALHGVLDNFDEGIFVSLNGYTDHAVFENYSWDNSLTLYKLKDLIRLYKDYFDKLFQEQQEIIDDSQEWVYDDIFKYGISDLEKFAKDVIEGVNVVGKTKMELIKIILNTLTVEDLQEICARYDIVQTKEDLINLIIKYKNKIK